jgi:outer membrane lipoprotein LolB
MSELKLFSLAAFMLLLGACAMSPPVDEATRSHLWQLRRAAMHDLAVWQVDGRTAISSEQGSGKLALHWRQDGKRFDISLMNFLGQQQARLQGINGGQTRLLRPSSPPLVADNEDDLMQEALGWSIPLTGLRFWVLGLPQPGAGMRKALDGQGRPLWLEQDGWHIDYTAYQDVDGFSLPRKLRLRHADLSARLVLDQWSLERGAE